MKKHKLLHWMIGMLGIGMITLTLFNPSKEVLILTMQIVGSFLSLGTLWAFLISMPTLQEKKDCKSLERNPVPFISHMHV